MTDDDIKEDELHLWVEIDIAQQGRQTETVALVIRFNENEELEIGLENRVFVLAPSQWQLIQAFLKHIGPYA